MYEVKNLSLHTDRTQPLHGKFCQCVSLWLLTSASDAYLMVVAPLWTALISQGKTNKQTTTLIKSVGNRPRWLQARKSGRFIPLPGMLRLGRKNHSSPGPSVLRTLSDHRQPLFWGGSRITCVFSCVVTYTTVSGLAAAPATSVKLQVAWGTTFCSVHLCTVDSNCIHVLLTKHRWGFTVPKFFQVRNQETRLQTHR